ncbi:hypothetical protein EJ063_04905 [Vibrio aquaticus]|uniref:Uncharacterized protein n=1 Tax=Vibrio aquaticus TaxID=2496559 RepID=A0A3S0MLY1_9VIBR|nr:hypothetical protein [Vibrio aquaticus]RTZ18129.1 hypothetical protein EJ063_04905 [Vibrio aquaticus]
MAVVPKHNDVGSRYDPSQDLTAEQLHRFGQVAGKAQERRKERSDKGLLSSRDREYVSKRQALKDAAFKPIVRPKKDQRNTVRYAVWMLVVMIGSLWLMYMTR